MPSCSEDTPGFRCTDCGKCCLEGAAQLPVTEADLARWKAQAPHLLDWVDGDRTRPRAGRASTRCPWIRKRPNRDAYSCRIYEYRPDVCRNYPTSRAHARFTGCPGYGDDEGGSDGDHRR